MIWVRTQFVDHFVVACGALVVSGQTQLGVVDVFHQSSHNLQSQTSSFEVYSYDLTDLLDLQAQFHGAMRMYFFARQHSFLTLRP